MMLNPIRRMMTVLTLLACGQLAAQEDISPGMRTDWMDLVKGTVEESVGAEVREVRDDPDSGEHQVLIAIPKRNAARRDEIEEVRVVGRAPDRVEINLPEFETEWVDDYDNDYYGLLVRMKNGPDFPLRLFFSAKGGVLDNSVQEP